MKNIRPNMPDISQFEKKFREMIYEAQRNIRQLDTLEKENLSIRSELCTKSSLLQNEQKLSNELQYRLKLTSEMINRLEEEKMRSKIDLSNLSMNYESLIKERDILTQELLTCQTEIAKFKLTHESLENTLQREIRQREKLEQALMDLKNDNAKIIANVDMNITKISKEQKYLSESAKSIIQLNKRLQTFGLCSYAVIEKYKAQIKSLQHKLITLSVNELRKLPNNDKLHPEIENLCFKLKEMITELKSKLRDSAPLEEKLDMIVNELSINLTKIE
ncbi:uncharacterized protein LOC143427439 [Xylocopa sonorina]|uniref:uncharacterized protein LOC143427439 n=1 Tax=Xylocopa sonorina TaxID=1818115 RepID=UPI00403B2403